MTKRIMVDMSATLIHHGHIRLLKKAFEYGSVVVGLTTDEDIVAQKGYQPEISFEQRKEILEAIQYVDEVVPTPWLLDESILSKYDIDFLIHGNDNANIVDEAKLLVLSRTPGISSTQVRQSCLRAITEINNKKMMLTPGPAAVLYENLKCIKPLFGRGDSDYDQMSHDVLNWIRKLSGQDEVVMAQGSSTFALELALHTFVRGKILLLSTGYYSNRLEKLLPQNCELQICKYEDLESVKGTYDWLLAAYTETSTAFKIDIHKLRPKADQLKAKLYLDATGSIGLEADHNLADLMAFSSCKGLFGLTGACFVAHKSGLKKFRSKRFYFNLETHQNKMVTGPYHTIASLYGVMNQHNKFKNRVKKSKDKVLKKWASLVRKSNQPLLCTYLEGQVTAKQDNIVLYQSRSKSSGSVVCHLGEIYHDSIQIDRKINVKPIVL